MAHRTILIVDDHNEIRENTAEILALGGYRTLTAENGKKGVEIALAEKPDLIVCDIMMPELDGYGVLHLLRKNPETEDIPLIFLTAKAERTDLRRGMEMGADDYITKPFHVAELKLRIRNLIDVRKKLREKFSKQLVVNPSELVTTSADENFLLKALQAVEENMDNEKFGADEFCTAVAISRANVHRKLKALTGQSTSEFIRTIRLKRAAQLLMQKTASVSEIAYDTGFNNLSYFTRCFKEVYGVMPSEFAK